MILQLSPTTSSHLLNYKHVTTVNKRTAKISMSGIAIISMLHGYPRQHRMIGSFSATARLLVNHLCLC